MLEVLTVLFAFYLAAALVRQRTPNELERRMVMLSFCCLIPALVSYALPPAILAVLTLYVAFYLRRA